MTGTLHPLIKKETSKRNVCLSLEPGVIYYQKLPCPSQNNKYLLSLFKKGALMSKNQVVGNDAKKVGSSRSLLLQ